MTTKTTTYLRAVDTSAVEGQEPETVAQADAEAELTAGVLPVLTEVAKSYHGLITNSELAARLLVNAGVTTRSNVGTWLPRVLAAASALDAEAGRPPLTSLVVDKAAGTVGPAYVEVLRVTGAEPIEDDFWREKHAAAARMDCYRWAGANLPAGGGNAALSPRYDAVVTRDRRKTREEALPNVCPNCFMSIPPTGICDNCG